VSAHLPVRHKRSIIVKAGMAVAVLALAVPGGNGFVGYLNKIMALR
jgi:hypothetical protein